MEPQVATFIPWAEGPRNCPGQKFAQAEFVAVMATLFQNHRVRPVLREGESAAEGKRKLMQMADYSAITAITLQMQRPKSVSLHWVRKDVDMIR